MKGHTATVVDEQGTMIVFGGVRRGKTHGYVYALSLTTMKWKCICKLKYRRSWHSAALIDSSVYLFGGFYRHVKGDLLKYDVTCNSLKIVPTAGSVPGARKSHGSAAINKTLFIFGGKEAWHVDQNLYALNTTAKVWATIPIGANGSLPCHRIRLSMFSFESNLYLFGGYNLVEETCLNDLHEFSLKTSCWQEITMPGDGAGFSRRKASSATVVQRRSGLLQKVFILGGWG